MITCDINLVSTISLSAGKSYPRFFFWGGGEVTGLELEGRPRTPSTVPALTCIQM